MRQAADTLGLRLPDALIAALMQCNGGRLRRNRVAGFQPTPRWRRGLVLHGLAGLGYDEGLGWSAALCQEWGFPGPSLVLCHGGPWALLLDYRRCGADGEPAVVFCDTDHEVAGRPAEWTVAPTFADFLDRLDPVADRSMVALVSGCAWPVLRDALLAFGAEGPVREDFEGGLSLSLVGPESAETGVARLRALANRQPDGRLLLPERPDCGWLLETTVAPDALDDHLAGLQAALPGELILLYRVEGG